MTTLHNVKDSNGFTSKGWSFGTSKATQVGAFENGRQLKPRKISGWQITSPDGCERFCEGNWQQFVPFARLIIDNYGCTCELS